MAFFRPLLILVFLLPFLPIRAQGGFQSAVGNFLDQEAYGLATTLDGGYIACGRTEFIQPAFAFNAYFVRYDAGGDTLWTKSYRLPGNQIIYDIIALPDGGFTAAGYLEKDTIAGRQAFLMRLDANGDSLWTRTTGGPENEIIYGLCQGSSGGYLLTGTLDSAGMGKSILLRTDSAGGLISSKILRHAGQLASEGREIIPLSSGNYALAGTNTNPANRKDMFLLVVDDALDTLLFQNYPVNGKSTGNSLDTTLDGGFIIAGALAEAATANVDYRVVRTDSLGIVQWARRYGAPPVESATSVRSRKEGGFYVSGWRTTFNTPQDYWLLRLDSAGDELWSRIFGGIDFDIPDAMELATDGSAVIAGMSMSFSGGDAQVYLVKADSMGNVMGLQEGGEERQLLFPNPATTGLHIRLPHKAPGGLNVRMYTIAGKLIEEWELGAGQKHWIEFGEVSEGLYIIEGRGKNEEFRKKIMIRPVP